MKRSVLLKAQFYLLALSLVSGCTCHCNYENYFEQIKTPQELEELQRPKPVFYIGGDSDSGTAGPIQTVYFDFKQVQPLTKSLKDLEENIVIMKNNPDLKILVEGHCDNVGGQVANIKLGGQRAEYIRNYMVQRGIDASRLTMISMGKLVPLVSNNPDESKVVVFKDRRANFVILDY